MYDHIRDTYFTQITQTHKELENKSNFDKLPYLLGETLSRPDLSSFIMALFLFGQGVSWGGHSMFCSMFCTYMCLAWYGSQSEAAVNR